MSAVQALVQTARQGARKKRARLFHEIFAVDANTRILALDAGDGSGIAAVLAGSGTQPRNVYIADSRPALLEEGHERYGFEPVLMPAAGPLPFEDRYFDMVYCASMIDRVAMVSSAAPYDTANEDEEAFRRRARVGRHALATEIRRLGKRYYVQTPNKWFPIETRTWVPFLSYLPREYQRRVIAWANRHWLQRARDDRSLLTAADMQELFPDAVIRRERFMGLTKSILALKP